MDQIKKIDYLICNYNRRPQIYELDGFEDQLSDDEKRLYEEIYSMVVDAKIWCLIKDFETISKKIHSILSPKYPELSKSAIDKIINRAAFDWK